jgi:hypothetical protein
MSSFPMKVVMGHWSCWKKYPCDEKFDVINTEREREREKEIEKDENLTDLQALWANQKHLAIFHLDCYHSVTWEDADFETVLK